MTKRRHFLGSIACSIPLLAGCTSLSESKSSSPTQSEQETPTPTPAPPDDPYYPDGISGDIALKYHRKGIRTQGGHRTIHEVHDPDGANQRETIIDSIQAAQSQLEWGEFIRGIYYDGSKIFGYTESGDGRKYRKYNCLPLNNFTNLFNGDASNATFIVSNATYVYDGISQKFDIPLQKYSSIGTQMLTADNKTILEAYSPTLAGESHKSEEITIDRWKSTLWFDAHKIARYQKIDISVTLSDPSESHDLTHITKIPSVGDRSVSEPEWYNNAKAVVNGTQCKRFE